MKVSARIWQRLARLLSMALVVPLLLAGCGKTDLANDSSSLEELTYLYEEAVKTSSVFTAGEYTLYYTNSSYTAIYETVKQYDFSENWSAEDMVMQILNDLINVDWIETKDKNMKAVSIVPIQYVGIKGIREDYVYSQRSDGVEGMNPVDDVTGDTGITTKSILQIEMSEDYFEQTPNQNVVFRTGMGKALLNLGIFDAIELYTPSDKVPDSRLADTINSSDAVILNQYNKDFYTDRKTVTLYFASEDGLALTAEKRTVTLSLTDKLPEVILRELIKGPEREGLSSTIPAGTTVNEIMIKDKVCYLDLSIEFQKNQTGDEREGILAVYSIVNSLTRLSSIEYVQFLINGQRAENLGRFTQDLSYVISD